MKKCWSYIGMTVVFLMLCFAKNGQVAFAEEMQDTMTMTELYNSRAYDTARTNGRTITVSSLTEFVMFQKAAVEDTKKLEGLSFIQTEDIVASECTFTYDEASNLICVVQEKEIIGYVDGTYTVYDSQKVKTTWEKLGLQAALSTDKNSIPVEIKGNYNGQNHILKGFIIGKTNASTTSYGGLFANLSATLKNISIRDCCVLGSYGPVANVLQGKLDHVSVQDCVEFGADNSCMIGWGIAQSVISDCTVKDCTIANDSMKSSRTRFGGMASLASGLTIQNCSLQNVHIYSQKSVDITAGGMVGVAEKDMNITITGCVADSSIERFSEAGGMIGEVQEGAAVRLTNCVAMGNIGKCQIEVGISGGLVGKITSASIVVISNSVSTMQLETTGYSGGIIAVMNMGTDSTSAQISNCLFTGTVSAEKTGAIVGNASDVIARQCYAIQSAGALFDENIYENAIIKDCYSISKEQLRGTEKEKVITETGTYKGFCNVLDMLNLYVEKASDVNLTGWIALKNRQPVPNLEKAVMDVVADIVKDDSDIADDTPVPDTSPSAAPSSAPSSAPSTEPSSAPSTEPSSAPSTAPSSAPSTAPSSTPSTAPSNAPSTAPSTAPSDAPSTAPSSTPALNSNSGSDDNSGNGTSRKDQKQNTTQRKVSFVKKAKAEAISNKAVKLTWDKKSDYSKIILYYSTDGRKYKKITSCGKKKNAYIWKAGKPGKKYYFRFVTYQLQKGKLVKGQAVTKKLLLPSLTTPVYRLGIGKKENQKYMQIVMKKYQGKYIEIALKKGNAAFKQAPMVSHRIAYYDGKIIFTYRKGGVIYSCKLRTYLIKNGRKKYSAYSKVQKIRI